MFVRPLKLERQPLAPVLAFCLWRTLTPSTLDAHGSHSLYSSVTHARTEPLTKAKGANDQIQGDFKNNWIIPVLCAFFIVNHTKFCNDNLEFLKYLKMNAILWAETLTATQCFVENLCRTVFSELILSNHALVKWYSFKMMCYIVGPNVQVTSNIFRLDSKIPMHSLWWLYILTCLKYSQCHLY